MFIKTNGDESGSRTVPGKMRARAWKTSTSWLNYIILVIRHVLSLISSHRETFFFVALEETTIRKIQDVQCVYQNQPPAPAGRWSMLIQWNITIANRKLQNRREKVMRGNQRGRKKGNFLPKKKKSPWLKIVNVAFCLFVSFKGNNGTVKSLLERLSCKQFWSVHSGSVVVLGAFSIAVASPEPPGVPPEHHGGRTGTARPRSVLYLHNGQCNSETPEKANPTSRPREQKQCEQWALWKENCFPAVENKGAGAHAGDPASRKGGPWGVWYYTGT